MHLLSALSRSGFAGADAALGSSAKAGHGMTIENSKIIVINARNKAFWATEEKELERRIQRPE